MHDIMGSDRWCVGVVSIHINLQWMLIEIKWLKQHAIPTSPLHNRKGSLIKFHLKIHQ